MIVKVKIAVNTNPVVKEPIKQKKSLIRKKKSYSNSQRNTSSAYTALEPDGMLSIKPF